MAVSTDKPAPDEDTAGMLTPPEGGHVPFDGKAKSLKISKQVHESQLIEEVYGRLGDRKDFEVVITGDPGEQLLYVLGDVDMRTVRGAVESHTPDPDHWLDDSEKEIRHLKDRLASGEDLPSSDLNKLLRAMI
jgi:hypothetical protein